MSADLFASKNEIPVIAGQDIIFIRTLTGKAKEQAMQSLYAATEKLMESKHPDTIYIPGNTASSKNSKEIGRYLKKNEETGEMESFTTLVNSKIARKYKKQTAGYWLKHKVGFLNLTRHEPLPLRIEFTFIRDSLRRHDFINSCQSPLDLMVEFGWLKDDESAYVIPSFGNTFYHKKYAGVLIRVIKR